MELREKVSLAVAHCLRSNDCSICEACPYNEGTDYGCRARLRDDIIELLKVQEPMEPEPKEVIYDDVHRSVYCPSCDNRLAGLTYSGAVALETEETPNYCWMCGQAVKWE